MSFEQFSTELEYDFVTVSDGVTTWALNGALANLMDGEDDAPSDFRSSGSSMTVVFTSDDSVGGDGFVARYDCVQPAPPLARVFMPLAAVTAAARYSASSVRYLCS